MKKQYETPEAKMVEFDYREQVVASGTVKQIEAGAKCLYTDPCTGATKECWSDSKNACEWKPMC